MASAASEAFKRLPDRVKRCVLPSLRLQTTVTSIDKIGLGQSRIGGQPDLPPEFRWPRFDGLALSFIAQLDLHELATQPDVLPLPKEGYLVFFYDSEQRTWGHEPKDFGSALVAYFPGPASALVRTELPADVSESGQFQCCTLAYRSDQNLPVHYDPELSEEAWTLLSSYEDARLDESDTPWHRLGGHADCLQTAMEFDCQLITNDLFGDETGYEDPRSELLAQGAKDWRLLLQIDTDDDAGFMWGDCGRIYYWIRDDDLRAGDFDRSWLILQCA